MDVILPYGINYKKCGTMSFSGYKRGQLIPFLYKNLNDKKSEVVMAIVAEMHCSTYYNDIENFIISFYANHLIISNLTYAVFIFKCFEKIGKIKESLPKCQHNISLINSNEIRNIYCSIFSNFLETKHNKFIFKIETKCYLDEVFLIHSNLKSFNIVFDDNNIALSEKLSRGIREILYWTENPALNVDNIEKILYWINWCCRIESLEKKIYSGVILTFNSKFSILNKIKKNNGWEFFLWTKIWNINQKNNHLNKNLLRSLTKLFFLNYTRAKLKERAGILALGILVCNFEHKIKIERKITKMEIFTSLNANQFYKNISIEDDNDDKYLDYYNTINNIEDTKQIQKIYKANKMESKLDFLKSYIPKDETKSANIKNVTDYFS